MKLAVDVQNVSQEQSVPDEEDFRRWSELALVDSGKTGFSVVLRIVDEPESQQLNADYRNKNYPTNVLSFPFEMPEFVEEQHLGDLVICAPVVNREATEQHKELDAHWAHMVIHGMLHLQGYDHIEADQADEMEGLEIDLLQQLNINNPYED